MTDSVQVYEEEMSETIIPNFLPNIDPTSVNVCKSITVTEPSFGPIFSIHTTELKTPENFKGNFTHMAVSNNYLVCLLVNSKQTLLLRFELKDSKQPASKIQLQKNLLGYKVSNIYLDPTGHHLLIGLIRKSPSLTADLLYVPGNKTKINHIEKFQDFEITAIGFNNYIGTKSTTGSILLGNSCGMIFEANLTPDQFIIRKQVYNLGFIKTNNAITGLEILRLANINKYIVIATTPENIYTFQETLKPEETSLQGVFAAYVVLTKEPIIQHTNTSLHYSVLSFNAAPNQFRYPERWAWLAGANLRFGAIAITNAYDANSRILREEDFISLDFDEIKDLAQLPQLQNMPKSFILTEFHAVLLYGDHITAICLLNKQIVYEEFFSTADVYELCVDIKRDQFTGNIYIHTHKEILQLKLNNEDRHIWSIYLSKGLCDLAEIYAAGRPEQLNAVWIKKAELAFAEQQFDLAAIIYAQTEKAFEEVCLKFIDLPDKHALITYIKKRLDKIEQDPEELLALVTWLTDLYLTEINKPNYNTDVRQQWQQEYDNFQQDERVLKTVRENSTAFEDLIKHHSDLHNLSKFAKVMGDLENVIKIQLCAEKYSKALAALQEQTDVRLYYKYGPILLDQMPRETVDVLISKSKNLDITKLLPTLVASDEPRHIVEIIRYLEYAINELCASNQAIHNFLIRLYAQYKPSEVITYLQKEGKELTLLRYDVNYALSVCTQYKVREACVFLQCLLGMWSAAVDSALKFDVQLAKQAATRPHDDEKRRELWLRIAYHELNGTKDIKKALAILKECDLMHLEDLLPIIADFDKIDGLKEKICEALQGYNNKIQELREGFNESTKQAECVRENIQNLHKRSLRIHAEEKCLHCETYLLTRSFFIFLCGHKFHYDCFETEAVKMLKSEKIEELNQLQNIIFSKLANKKLSSYKKPEIEQLQKSYNNFLAANCLYCDLMIEAIDKPLVVEENGLTDFSI